MKNKPNELPRIAVKFANMVFLLGILFSIFLIVYAIYKIYDPLISVAPAFYIISMLSGGVLATLFGLGLKILSNNLKVNLSVLFFTIGIAVYGFETYLEFFLGEPRSHMVLKREIIAKQMGVPYDTRKYIEVLDDLIDSGVEAYPNLSPRVRLTENDVIYNLGGISNSITILGNESGYYPIIETDEHGFNNPKGLYNKNKVDIILTGDSFTEGKSVHSNESISAVLWQLDFNAISVGKAGNGPLTELAALKEYAEPLKPKIVLWLYYIGDLSNLNSEMKSSILKKYLNEDDYSQNLISRQKEIDSVLKNYVQSMPERDELLISYSVKRIAKLYNLRKRINLIPNSLSNLTLTSTTVPIFRDILQKSKQMVSEWGGKMYFVYLPSFSRYSKGDKEKNHDIVMQTATELNIPIIDIHREVFDPHPDPLSLFPFRLYGHYTAEGYRLIAEAIGKRLEADDYVPIKSKK